MNKKYMQKTTMFGILLVFTLLSISFIYAEQSSIGPYKAGDTVSLIQTCGNCTYCNVTSLNYPNGTQALDNTAMVKDGVEYTYDYTTNESITGIYIVNTECDVDSISTPVSYDLIITANGKDIPTGMPTFQGIILLVVFGTAWFMLFLSIRVNEAGPKIFFMILSFIFVMATMMTAYQVSIDYNVTSSLNTTLGGIVFVVGMIILVIFFYILIRQTIVILDYFKVKRGLKWGGAPAMRGYGPNGWMY